MLDIEQLRKMLTMPRRRDRFANLKRQLKASGGSPTAGTVAEKYLKFISGATPYKVLNAQKDGKKQRALVTLLPFNKNTGTVRYGAFITRYAFKNQGVAGVTQTDAGQEKIPVDAAKFTYDAAYNPAIITWRSTTVDDALEAKDSKTSQITGKSYKFLGGRAGTSPFGKKDTTDLEDDRAKLLQAAVRAKATSIGATYQPEEWNAPFNPTDATVRFAST